METLRNKDYGPANASFTLIKELALTSPAKIVLMVIDGLGGLPDPETGKTELETANLPNLNQLAAKGVCGLTDAIGQGITPGSAPGHLALFGYDPVSFNIGRGAVEAIGIDYDLQPGDMASRGNFCTVNEAGLITDRRAGRISTEKCAELCKLIDGIEINDVRVAVRPVREHRLVAVFQGKDLISNLNDSDPQQTGVTPNSVSPLKAEASTTASIVNEFIAQAGKILTKHYPANMVLLRGFSRKPVFPTMTEIYQLKPAAIASYPMYRGLAKLVGMEVLETGTTIKDEFVTLKRNYTDYNFFFIHIKGTDSAGEDGDFAQKVSVLEELDGFIPELTNLNPDVIVVAGDHSTPALLKGHSWHPIPILLYSRYCRMDQASQFSESACLSGGLGRIPAIQVMPLAMANALKLLKFGA
ncbi:2,3-bisphosphoglycerate-independent phosphoglycerate mutase [Chloroflexota bacterium]